MGALLIPFVVLAFVAVLGYAAERSHQADETCTCDLCAHE